MIDYRQDSFSRRLSTRGSVAADWSIPKTDTET
jgi:hypothetical protein